MISGLKNDSISFPMKKSQIKDSIQCVFRKIAAHRIFFASVVQYAAGNYFNSDAVKNSWTQGGRIDNRTNVTYVACWKLIRIRYTLLVRQNQYQSRSATPRNHKNCQASVSRGHLVIYSSHAQRWATSLLVHIAISNTALKWPIHFFFISNTFISTPASVFLKN